MSWYSHKLGVWAARTVTRFSLPYLLSLRDKSSNALTSICWIFTVCQHFVRITTLSSTKKPVKWKVLLLPLLMGTETGRGWLQPGAGAWSTISPCRWHEITSGIILWRDRRAPQSSQHPDDVWRSHMSAQGSGSQTVGSGSEQTWPDALALKERSWGVSTRANVQRSWDRNVVYLSEDLQGLRLSSGVGGQRNWQGLACAFCGLE